MKSGPIRQRLEQFKGFHPRRWSFTTQLALFVVTIMATTLLVLSFGAYRTTRNALISQIGRNFEAQATAASDITATFLFGNVSELQALSLSETLERAVIARNATYSGSPAEITAEITALDRQWANAPDSSPFVTSITSASAGANRVVAQLDAFLTNYDEHTEIFVTDRYGATVGATGRPTDYYQADEAWWQTAWNEGQGDVFVSNPVFDPRTGDSSLLIAVPIHNNTTGQVIGILRATLLVEELQELLARQTIGETGKIVVVNRSGDLILQPTLQQDVLLPPVLLQRFRSGEAGFNIAPGSDGQESLFGFSPLSQQNLAYDGAGLSDSAENAITGGVTNLGWIVVVTQESDEAFASLERLARRNGSLALATAAAATVIAFFLAQVFTRPLARLSEAAEEVGAGRLDVPLPAAGNDEMNRLSASFGQMVAKLRQAFATLEQRVNERTAELARANNQLQAEVAERKQAQANLSRQNEYLAALQATALDLLMQNDLDHLLNEIVKRAAAMLACEHGYLFVIDSGQERMIQAAGLGLARKHTGQWRDKGAGLAGQAWAEDRTIVVDDYQQWPEKLPNFPFYHAVVAMPLHVGKEVVGVIGLAHSLPDRTFGPEQLAVLQQFATMASVALENARLLATIQQELAERRKVEETLRASEGRNRAILNAVPDLLFRIDHQGTFLDYAAKSEDSLFIPASAFLNRRIPELFPPDLSQAMMSCIQQAITHNDTQVLEYQLPDQTGRRDFESRFVVSGVNELLVIVRDITERKRAEEALRESERRLAQFMEAIPIGIFVLGRDGRPYYANQASQQILGSGIVPDVSPTQLAEVYHAYVAGTDQPYPAEQQPIVRALAGETITTNDLEIHQPNGIIPLEVRGTPVYDEQGNVAYAIAAFQDITERKRAEESLRYARDQALEASRLKSELLAKVSHELRTPLGAIMGYAEMLQEGIFGPLTSEQRGAAAEVIDSSHFLTSMVNELLDQAQLDAGRVKLNVTAMSPADLIEQVKSKMGVLAQTKGLALRCHLALTLPIHLCGDLERLQQILINLVGNAIKFTEQGEIRVQLGQPDENHWSIAIADTGTGIPAEAQAYIFEPFRQVDSSMTRLHRGTGLGLTIVKQLVTLMDGQISLTSELGRGSTFTVTLPLVLPEQLAVSSQQ